MTNALIPQSILFRQIKEKLLPHMSLADVIAEILSISSDSAYRRIRNEKKLELDEFYRLCKHFNISSDQIFNLGSQFVKFDFICIDEKSFNFEKFLEFILYDLKKLDKLYSSEIFCIFNELSLFQMLLIPEIAAFKLFFWSKSNFAFSSFKDLQFSLDHLTSKTIKLSNEIMQIYNRIPSTEFLASEVLSSMLKQLDFYYDAGYFNSTSDARIICDALTELLNHINKQAELGYKFSYGSSPRADSGNYKLYYNDIIIVDNTVLVCSDQMNKTYITSNVVNLLVSDNRDFFDENHRWANTLISKSVLISGASERDRNKIFRSSTDQISSFRKKLLAN